MTINPSLVCWIDVVGRGTIAVRVMLISSLDLLAAFSWPVLGMSLSLIYTLGIMPGLWGSDCRLDGGEEQE